MIQEPIWWQRARELHARGVSRGTIARLCGKTTWSVGYAIGVNKHREERRARALAWWAAKGIKHKQTPEQVARQRMVKMARDEARETGRHIDEVLIGWETHPRRGRAANEPALCL